MSVKMPATYAAKEPVSQEVIFAKMEAMDKVFKEKNVKHDNEMAAINSSVKSLQDEVKSLQEEKSEMEDKISSLEKEKVQMKEERVIK